MGGGGSFGFKRPAFPTVDFGGDCTFSFITTLISPRLDVIRTLAIGQRLFVRTNESTKALSVLNKEDESCGIVIAKYARVASCIEKGISFEAVVISIDGAACTVLIQNAK